jgi:hypothetical protein
MNSIKTITATIAVISGMACLPAQAQTATSYYAREKLTTTATTPATTPPATPPAPTCGELKQGWYSGGSATDKFITGATIEERRENARTWCNSIITSKILNPMCVLNGTKASLIQHATFSSTANASLSASMCS